MLFKASLYLNPAWSEPIAMVKVLVMDVELASVALSLWKRLFGASKQNPKLPMNSRFSLCASAIVLALLFFGCSTPDSRIKKDQVGFDSLPPAAKEKIRAGQV